MKTSLKLLINATIILTLSLLGISGFAAENIKGASPAEPNVVQDGKIHGVFYGLGVVSGYSYIRAFDRSGRVFNNVPEGGLEGLENRSFVPEDKKFGGRYKIEGDKITIKWNSGEGQIMKIEKGPEGETLLSWNGVIFIPVIPYSGDLAGNFSGGVSSQGGSSEAEFFLERKLRLNRNGTFEGGASLLDATPKEIVRQAEYDTPTGDTEILKVTETAQENRSAGASSRGHYTFKNSVLELQYDDGRKMKLFVGIVAGPTVVGDPWMLLIGNSAFAGIPGWMAQSAE